MLENSVRGVGQRLAAEALEGEDVQRRQLAVLRAQPSLQRRTRARQQGRHLRSALSAACQTTV